MITPTPTACGIDRMRVAMKVAIIAILDVGPVRRIDWI